ncbi:hypothetical protein BT63DRAFT_35092 [Microthyrium microscopicum]|uniref:Integral membrane protein n=1 Tax=Microthyrium microscopicum TaxID=703497 RepID=A0A6A6UV78_9PEZI|nr:hypothetical protein BT63DRAFT_35092 [Microthyrium microscopicum]
MDLGCMWLGLVSQRLQLLQLTVNQSTIQLFSAPSSVFKNLPLFNTYPSAHLQEPIQPLRLIALHNAASGCSSNMSNPINLLNNLGPQNPIPPDYTTPPFPSLYWPFPVHNGYSANAYYLYRTADIWRFTVVWTLLFFGVVHLATSTYANIILWRGSRKNWLFVWVVWAVYAFAAGIEGLFAGSITGALLGAVYNAGYFRMSTWIPFVWGLTNSLVLVLSGFALQSGL